MLRFRTLEAGEIYAALVTASDEKTATVDLGSATGTLSLSDSQWARKYNPTSHTPARSGCGTSSPGDIVLVRVVAGRVSPRERRRAGKPLALSLEQVPRVQGALVAIDPVTRGAGPGRGYDFALSQFKPAIQARRQPGSAFKPFVWGAAVDSRRYTPATLVYDTPDLYRDPWTGKEWKPQNFERDEYDGPDAAGVGAGPLQEHGLGQAVDALGWTR